MILGFTGTRNGMTKEQTKAFYSVLPEVILEFHHGMCEGADTEAHNIIRLLHPLTTIVGHPSMDKSHEINSVCDKLCDPLGHLARNRVIVNSIDLLLACPPSMEELQRGGTWFTIRYALKHKVPVKIIYPDGSIDYKNL